MKTRSLLISIPGYPFELRTLLPNHRLASLAASLLDSGHETRIVDYGTLSMLKELFPSKFRGVTRSLADHLYTDGKASPLETLRALWRLRGLKHSMLQNHGRFAEEIAQRVAQETGLDFVAIDVARAEELFGALTLARELRRERPGVKLVAFGPYIQSFGRLLASAVDVFDCFVMWDPENAVTEWAEVLSQPEQWPDIPNVRVLSEKSRRVERRRNTNLNLLPFPVYSSDVYPAMEEGSKLRLFGVECGRGCQGTCTHCSERSRRGGNVQVKSPHAICDEVSHILRQWNSVAFRFTGPVPNASGAALLAYEVLSRGLNIRYVRNGAVAGITPVILSSLRASGCESLSFRVETGSQWMLEDYYRRGIGVTPTEVALRASVDSAIFTVVQMAYPAPADDYHTRAETLRLLERARPHGALLALPEVAPGTDWHTDCSAFGYQSDVARYVQSVVSGDVWTMGSVRTWRGQRYGGSARSWSKAEDERQLLVRDVEELGISTSVTGELALVARIAGYGGHEKDFAALMSRRFFTGDFAGILSMVARFNEQAAVRTVPGSLGYYPGILAAVGN